MDEPKKRTTPIPCVTLVYYPKVAKIFESFYSTNVSSEKVNVFLAENSANKNPIFVSKIYDI